MRKILLIALMCFCALPATAENRDAPRKAARNAWRTVMYVQVRDVYALEEIVRDNISGVKIKLIVNTTLDRNGPRFKKMLEKGIFSEVWVSFPVSDTVVISEGRYVGSREKGFFEDSWVADTFISEWKWLTRSPNARRLK